MTLTMILAWAYVLRNLYNNLKSPSIIRMPSSILLTAESRFAIEYELKEHLDKGYRPESDIGMAEETVKYPVGKDMWYIPRVTYYIRMRRS